MLRGLIIAGLIGATALPLSGCMDCSRDPSQVGLGCATANLVGGVYEEDDAKIREEIRATDARTAYLREENARLNREANQLAGQRRNLTRRLAALNGETAQLSQQVADLYRRGRRDAELRELRERTQRLADEEAELNARSAAVKEAELRGLEAERDAIRRDINRLLAAS